MRCAWKTSTTPISPTSGRPSPSRTVLPAGSPRSRASLRVGGIVQAQFTSTWEGPGRIDVCDAPNHLVLTMEPGTEDEAEIEAVLTAEDERTRLVVEERGLPLDVLYKHGAGWQAHVEDLGRYLAGGQSMWKARWDELSPAYRSLTVS